MKYYISKSDSKGYVYSIDNLILEYIIKSRIDMIDYLRNLNKKYLLENQYWEKLNTPYCSKYQYYNNHIHLCDGIYIMIGKYDNYSDLSQTHSIFPILKLEINPNKHFEKPIFKELLKFLLENCGDCSLKRYDFCIDIKCKLTDIEVFGSRKERGLYKGTRYYGQRNKDGYLKIYDKQKEQGLEKPLTRIEYTFVNDKGKHSKQGFNIQDVYIKSCNNIKSDISSTNLVICNLYKMVLSLGGDPEPQLDILDRRKKQKILESLDGLEYNKIIVDEYIINELLKVIKKDFGVVEQKQVYTDSEGFLRCPEGFDIPF